MDLRTKLNIYSRNQARQIADELGDDECLACGGPRHEIHHRDGDPFNNHPMNLIPLCHRCHKAVHHMDRTVEGLQEWKRSLP